MPLQQTAVISVIAESRSLRCEGSDGKIADEAECAGIPDKDKPITRQNCAAAPECEY